MRLFLASLVFAAVAVTAAERGWFEPSSHQLWLTASASPAAMSARSGAAPAQGGAVLQALPETSALEGLLAESPESPEVPGPFVVHVESIDVPTEDAEPSPTFHVTVACGSKHFEARTNPDEPLASFPGLPDGPCQVEVAEPGWSRGVADVTIGQDAETTVTVSRPVALVVKVVDGRMKPVPGAQLTLSSTDGLPVGELVRAALPGAVISTSADEASPSAHRRIYLPEAPPRPERIILDDVSASEPVEAIPMEAQPMPAEEPPTLDMSAVTLAVPLTGTLELTDLPAGTFHLSASLAGATEGFRDVTVMAGQRLEVVIVLEKKASVEVTVSGAAESSMLDVILTQAGSDLPAGSVVSPGRYRFDDVPPGAVDVQVTLNGATVAMRPVLLGEGETKRLDLRVSVGTIEVSVAGLPPEPDEAPMRPGRHARRSFTAVHLECGEGAQALSYQSAVMGGVATFAEVPTGVRCRATLGDRPLAGSVEVQSPGQAKLVVSSNSVELVAPGERDFIAVQLTGAAGSLAASGQGRAVVANIAPGHYEVSGRLGDGAVHASVDVSGTAGQRLMLQKARPTCFSVRAVDATSGEAVSASLSAYVRGPTGSLDLAEAAPASPDVSGDRACFVGEGFIKVVVSAGGYQTVSFGAGQEDLGDLRLTPHAADSNVLADDLTMGANGAMVVQGHASGTVGLRTGDEVLAIDGHATTGLVWEELTDLLGGERGSALRLQVRRAEGVQELSIPRP